MNIVIVGHTDHGKSTIIGRLLYDSGSIPEQKLDEISKTCELLGRNLEFAYITDALEEERVGQLTIDTTQTFFRGKNRDYAIIDVPGHKEFLKNMVTGASLADAAILIMDGKEGIKEQTKRHAYVLTLLGIRQLIVAINKMDTIDYDELEFRGQEAQLLRYLDLIGLRPTAIVPISAYGGDNVVWRSNRMSWYGGQTILESLNSLKEESMMYDFRMPIQDEYKVEGKDVYVGNIL